jgi:hypothetical protein
MNATNQKTTWASGEYDDKTWDDKKVANTISYEDRLASVEANGGFYVARYEAGIPEEMTGIYANTDGASYVTSGRNVDTYTPVSKKGVQAWNFISQTKAKSVAQKMVSNDTVQSYLIDSYAWDLVCKKIDTKYGNNKSITNSTTWGNYYDNTTTKYESINTLFAIHTYNNTGCTNATNYQKGLVTGAPKNSGNNRIELTTGASDDFKAYNLYDIAGNMWEWTTETSTNNYTVGRGGGFLNFGYTFTAVYRLGVSANSSYVHVGFRSVLYLK